MGIDLRIDSDAGILYTTLRGAVTVNEIVDAFNRLFKSPDFRPGLSGLADTRESQFSSSQSDVRRLADLMIENRDRIGPSRTAIVVDSDIDYGMARMYEVFAEQSMTETRVFKDIDQAMIWLKD